MVRARAAHTQNVGYVASLSLLWLGWRAGRDERLTTLALTMTVVTSVLVLTSPVLSPQYLLWLLPGIMRVEDARLRRFRVCLPGPHPGGDALRFDGLLTDLWWFSVLFRVVVAVRNVLLVLMAARGVILLWRGARDARPDPQPSIEQ